MKVLGEYGHESGQVAVPAVHWYEPDPSVIGAPFFLMDRVPGEVQQDIPPYWQQGWLHESPKDEPAVQHVRNWFQARAGGGLLISLRWRVLFRLEASNMVLYTEDAYQNVQTYIGGLGTYF